VAPQDPALRLDVVVTTSPAGAVRLRGTGAVSPPATLGVRIDGVPAGPSGDELARLTADAVRAELVVRVPGRVLEHDADVLSDGVARWELPVGDARSIVLVSEDVPLWRRVPAVLVLAAAVVLGAGIRWRRRTPTGPPAARADGAGGADDGQR